jgi:hypothetical protein
MASIVAAFVSKPPNRLEGSYGFVWQGLTLTAYGAFLQATGRTLLGPQLHDRIELRYGHKKYRLLWLSIDSRITI